MATRTTKTATVADERDELRSQVDDLKKQLNELTAMIAAGGAKQTAPAEEDTITIGCNMLGGITLSTKDESITFTIPYGETIDVYVSDFRAVLMNPFGYRELFRTGIIYFENEADYRKFKMRKELDMSRDFIKQKMCSPDCANWAKDVTNDQRATNVTYCLVYQVASLFASGELNDNNWNYAARTAFQSYFKIQDIGSFAATVAGM